MMDSPMKSFRLRRHPIPCFHGGRCSLRLYHLTQDLGNRCRVARDDESSEACSIRWVDEIGCLFVGVVGGCGDRHGEVVEPV